jgi:hypothetical protein
MDIHRMGYYPAIRKNKAHLTPLIKPQNLRLTEKSQTLKAI